MRNHRPHVFLLLVVLVLGAPGCTTFALKDGALWSKSEDEPANPTNIVEVWTDDVLHRQGQVSKRGFGGRIMFHNQEGDAPIRVDGRLTVFVFDDRCEDPLHDPPMGKYVFPAETLSLHYSKTDLGHSYSFWVPIDDVGGVERKLTIRSRFESKLGGVILGDPTTHMLPGRPVDERPVGPLVQRFEMRKFQKQADGGIKEIAHASLAEPPSESEATEADEMTTATINLPPAFARQILNAPPQPIPSPPAMLPHDAQAESINPVIPASATIAAPATQAGSAPPAQPPSRFQPSRFPARAGALGRPVASRARTQPLRARWPSALPSTPRSAGSAESPPPSTPDSSPPLQSSEAEAW